jgi:hypothetical protein
MDAASEIVKFEILRARLTANGGVIFAVEDDPASAVTLTNAQKQVLLGQEVAFQQTIKNLSAAWGV